MLKNLQPITVGVFYRPPNYNKFLEELNNDFNKLYTEKNEVIILGDLNINLLQNDNYILNLKNSVDSQTAYTHPLIKQYRQFISNFGLTQIIKEPTRITCDTSTLIDHILINSDDKISQYGVIDIGLSDHQMIYCTRKLVRNKTGVEKYIESRSLKNYSVDDYERALKDLDFPNYEIFSDVDIAYFDFIQRLTSVLDEIAPLKKSRTKNNSQEWFDGEVAEQIVIRDKNFKKFKKSKLHVDREIFLESKKKVSELIKSKKQAFFENKLNENVGNPKGLWRTIHSLGLPKKSPKASNICLNQNGENIFSPQSTAEIFKDFFSNIANNLATKLPVPTDKFGDHFVSSFYKKLNIKSNFHFTPTTKETVHKILNNLEASKAPGIDNIKSMFLKDGAKILAAPIAQLCNLSMSTTTFPSECKIAKLKPLFKKGCKTEPKNYRPISLLPIISKIIEKVVHQKANDFLNENNILYKFQSGFRNNHSTASCLSYLNDKIIKGFDSGLLTGMILIDLQKAFDTIDHKILLGKMVHLNFSADVISWFKSYLAGRTFKVYVNEYSSSPGNLTCGVPQGSILGPLLFLLYINDMPESVSSDLFLYADDSCLVFQHKDLKEIEKQLNKDFANLCDWFVENKLSIHFGDDKTKSILFVNKYKLKRTDKLVITYEGKEIKQHSKVNYLGCILDETLSGDSMALSVLSKINAKIKFLYRKNKFLTPLLRRLLCNALIQPHFDYACSAWYPNLNKAMKSKLQHAQNKCIRFCLQLGNRNHIGIDELERINWLNVNDRFEQCISVSAFKFFSNKSPSYMADIFIPVGKDRASTRNSYQKLSQPFRKTTQGQNSLSYLGPSIWNKLSENLKKCKSVNTFKHTVKNSYFNEIKRKRSLGLLR